MNNILYINWNIDPIIVTIGPFTLTYYGILFTGGIVLCSWLIGKILKKDAISEIASLHLSTYCYIGIIIGARLGHCLFYEPIYYLSHPLEIILPFKFDNGEFLITGYRGLASHGGAIGLIIALILYSKKYKLALLKILDYIALVTPIAAGFIRLANLMNSEIIGKSTNMPWAFIFERIDSTPRHPAQLYEAIAYFTIYILTYYLYKIGKMRKQGFIFGFVIFSIFTFRFFIEFIKERQVEFEETIFLDMGQILSIPFIILGLYFMLFHKINDKKQN